MTDELVVTGGLVFDGRGGEGVVADVRIVDGAIVSVGPAASRGPGARIIDARGRWVTPGFVDMHTHYDAEVEAAPGLAESLRHGVTTVVTGSCSLSLAVGEPRDLADMFCRVEAIPRERVLPLLERVKDWSGPREYHEHLDGLALGPNVACFLGHSTIRAAAMGLERSLTAGLRPSKVELARMDAWLDEALDAGYLGLSISTLPWDKMDGEEASTYRSRPMPSVFATWSEYRHLARALRARGRVQQGVPKQ
jgi:N-acyl-D-aspartate/D-glutamate deacylase